ncbi:hypothetical protein MTBUT4_300038 [Magnetospirillum sp. UT-4]|nr:hypothetical protein MTBUT4_300038 [Magnetospirillum sp. UT-4]
MTRSAEELVPNVPRPVAGDWVLVVLVQDHRFGDVGATEGTTLFSARTAFSAADEERQDKATNDQSAKGLQALKGFIEALGEPLSEIVLTERRNNAEKDKHHG